jgi:3-oxoacyl-[acyl-carrier protein] reductase
MPMPSLDKQVALVTGASRGIGRAIALELGRQGAYVVGTSTTAAGAEKIGQLLAQGDAKGQGMVLDVTDAAAIARLLADMENSSGPPSILVNNAGITRDGLLLRMKDDDWDIILDTDLKSVFRVTKACLRPMTKARSGRVINISSVVALTGNPGQVNYAAAKAGIFGFTRSLAREVGSRNITVNAVAPGLIDTDMTRALPPEHTQAMLQNIALGRLGLAEEVAHAVAFLASPQAAYITGATLHVNGGMYMN